MKIIIRINKFIEKFCFKIKVLIVMKIIYEIK